MTLAKSILGNMTASRAMALLGCLILFYFAAGGAFLHQHQGGHETPCHICQALHLPALLPSGVTGVAAPEPVSWYLSLPAHAAPSDAFCIHHAGRAPPAA
jgi:hypothetical protein